MVGVRVRQEVMADVRLAKVEAINDEAFERLCKPLDGAVLRSHARRRTFAACVKPRLQCQIPAGSIKRFFFIL